MAQYKRIGHIEYRIVCGIIIPDHFYDSFNRSKFYRHDPNTIPDNVIALDSYREKQIKKPLPLAEED